MKTKWQVWAHLLCTNYSITALKKITKWLRSKNIINLQWTEICAHNTNKREAGGMSYFMAWYKDDSPTCATYPRLAKQIQTRYEMEYSRFLSKFANDITKRYNSDDMDIEIPF